MKDNSPKLNETEQGIFDWGLDFLEKQRKSLEAMNKNFGVTNKLEVEHISTQILLLDKFVKLIKDKTVLIPWEAELNTVKGRMKTIKNEMQCWKNLPLIVDVLKLNKKILELLLRKRMTSKHFEKAEEK